MGTPYDEESRSVDYTQLDSAVGIVMRFLRKGDIIILKSTVPPGTTNVRLRRLVDSKGFKVPGEVGLAFCPERLIEGQAIGDLTNLPKPIGATDERTLRKAKRLLSSLGGKIIEVSSPETAEMVKLVDNYSRYTFLGLTNEIALMAEKNGIDVYELLDSAKEDYPRNAGLLKPGPGVGGSCLNKDPFILSSEMAKLGLDLKMVAAAKSVNDLMPAHIVDIVNMFAKGRRTVCIAGVAFKGDTADTRFTPAFAIRAGLERLGFRAAFTDPFVPSKDAEISKNLYGAASGSEILLILADHSEYRGLNLARLKKGMAPRPLIIDTRDVVARKEAEKAGIEYHGLGRL